MNHEHETFYRYLIEKNIKEEAIGNNITYCEPSIDAMREILKNGKPPEDKGTYIGASEDIRRYDEGAAPDNPPIVFESPVEGNYKYFIITPKRYKSSMSRIVMPLAIPVESNTLTEEDINQANHLSKEKGGTAPEEYILRKLYPNTYEIILEKEKITSDNIS